jgi:hypothetical protein
MFRHIALLAIVPVAIAPLALAVVPAAGATAAPSSQRVKVISSCTKATYQPKSYIFFCADGGAGLKQATYAWWTVKTAHGSGTYYFNDCKPSCAGGTVHEQAAEFTAYRVRDTKNHGELFTRVEVDTRHAHHVFQMPTATYG